MSKINLDMTDAPARALHSHENCSWRVHYSKMITVCAQQNLSAECRMQKGTAVVLTLCNKTGVEHS